MFKRRARVGLMMMRSQSIRIIRRDRGANAGPGTRDHESDGPSSGDFANGCAETMPQAASDDPSDFRNAGGPGTPSSLTFWGIYNGEASFGACKRLPGSDRFHLQHPKL